MTGFDWTGIAVAMGVANAAALWFVVRGQALVLKNVLKLMADAEKEGLRRDIEALELVRSGCAVQESFAASQSEFNKAVVRDLKFLEDNKMPKIRFVVDGAAKN